MFCLKIYAEIVIFFFFFLVLLMTRFPGQEYFTTDVQTWDAHLPAGAAYLWTPIWTASRRCTWAPCSSWSWPPNAWWRAISGTGDTHGQRGRATTTGAVRPTAAATATTATATATGPARFPRNKHPAPVVYLLIQSARFYLHLFAPRVALSRTTSTLILRNC